jgi:hypothetical protein
MPALQRGWEIPSAAPDITSASAVHNKTMEDLGREYPDAVITSPATKERNRQVWTRPKVRRQRIKGIRQAVATLEVKAKHSASMKLAQADPEKKPEWQR